MNNKIKSLAPLKKVLRRYKNKRVVFTNGCFDLLHRGHVEYLKKAKSLGDILIVGLNSDASVRRLKGKARPITPQMDRANIVASLESVDFVTIFNDMTPLRLIDELRPNILVKGADWEKDKIIGSKIVKSCGGKVVVVKFLKGYSTTKLLNAIKKKI